MYLVIDAGNTRVKWALANGAGLDEHASAAHADFASCMRSYLDTHGSAIAHTLVANVAGAVFEHTLAAVIRERAGSAPIFLQSTRELGDVRNAYRVPEKLGIDRFVGMIGAVRLQKGPLCVVSVGTAMTIDVVDGAAQHRGGLIVPGPRLMISSLVTNTSEIGQRAASGHRDHAVLAVDTLGAITQGAEQALAALVDRVTAKLEPQLGEPLKVILTGGAADLIRDLLSAPALLVPDLTLQGLAAVAQQAVHATRR